MAKCTKKGKKHNVKEDDKDDGGSSVGRGVKAKAESSKKEGKGKGIRPSGL